MPKDYYLVLGLPADSTQREIKEAYRRLAKKFHPDRCHQRHSPFLGIQEAYSILGDPELRKKYDDQRDADRARTPTQSERRSRSASEIVEPLIPERPFFGHPGRPGQEIDQGYYGPVEDLAGSHVGGQGLAVVEVVLTRQQAMAGGVVRLQATGPQRCPACGGSGGRGLFRVCLQCGGTGAVSFDYPVRLEFPPGIPDNSTLRVFFDVYGKSLAWLTVRFRVRP